MFECNLCIIIGELIWMDSDRLGTCTNEWLFMIKRIEGKTVYVEHKRVQFSYM